MPQMSPLSWLSLMIIFVLIMVMFNLVNYYVFNYNTSKNKLMTKKENLINWKW